MSIKQITERTTAARADLEAAARYRSLAKRWPWSRREYLKRADEAERIGNAKLAELTQAEQATATGRAAYLEAIGETDPEDAA